MSWDLKRILITVGIVLLCLGLIGLIIDCVIYALSLNIPYMHAVVIDAGSTGSRLMLYQWLDKPFRTNGLIEQLASQEIEPGISSYLQNPQKCFENLEMPLKTLVSNLTTEEKHKTPVYLAATAGMRLAFIMDPVSSLELFEIIRRGFMTTGLKMDAPNEQIRLLSGGEEGLYGWVSVNYIARTIGEGLHEPPLSTIGSLDLGGASTQISFIPETEPTTFEQKVYIYPIKLFGNGYNVYSFSFLCYGKKEMGRRISADIVIETNGSNSTVQNPCYLSGYTESISANEIFSGPCIEGSFAQRTFGMEIKKPSGLENVTFIGYGDFDQCRRIVEKQFQNNCTHSTCSFNNVYQPIPRGKFMAYSAFAYIITFLFGSNKEGLTKGEIENKVREYCNKTWDEVKKTVPQKTWKYAAGYCQDGIYLLSLLTHYGFKTDDQWKNITFALKINGASVSWALGYVLDQSGHLPSESPKISLSTTAFAFMIVLFIIMVIVGIVLIIVAKCKLNNGTSASSLFEYER